jgi:hypothetical protein
MDISCCRERIERLLVGRTGMIVKVIHNAADSICYLRPIVLKLNMNIRLLDARSLLSTRFFIAYFYEIIY